jgi:DnaJ-class molecular chaperone
MATPQPNLYEILALPRGANRDEIRGAYKLKALALHPDKNPNGEALFKVVSNAYQTLMSPGRKCAYDRELDKKEARRPAFGAPPQNDRPPNTYRRSSAAQAAFGDCGPDPQSARRPPGGFHKATEDGIFKDAYQRYKEGTDQRYKGPDAGAKAHQYGQQGQQPQQYEDTSNFGEWFRKKQEEFKKQEEISKAKAEYAKRLEEEERRLSARKSGATGRRTP